MSKHGHHETVRRHEHATEPHETMTGIVHVRAVGDGMIMNLNRHARITVLSRDAQELTLRCETGADRDFHDPSAIETLPDITLPMSIYNEHDQVLIFRLVQSAPQQREYTFKVGKNGLKLTHPEHSHEHAREMAAALSAELNAQGAGSEEQPSEPQN